MKSFRFKVLSVIILITMIFTFGCSSASELVQDDIKEVSEVNLTIGCAAGLTDAVTELSALYEASNPNVKLTLNFASSGTLQQQIEQGADIDVFISAANKQVNTLKEQNLINENTLKTIAANKLALITYKDSQNDFKSTANLVNFDSIKIAVGDSGFVPAGKYADEVFKSLNISDSLNDKLVLAKDVREVLAWVESGNADVGFVYQTDALISDKVKTVEIIDDSLHSPIVYPACLVSSSKNPEQAQNFLDYLSSDDAKEIFDNYGFMPSN